MKNLLVCLICLLPAFTHAQEKSILGAGQYAMDSTECKLCANLTNIHQYYSVHVKYPLSSEAITQWANDKINPLQDISGYITVRFIVNCKGEKNCFHIYQTDKEFKTVNFGNEITDKFLDFVKAMKDWPIGIVKTQAVDYYAYLTFKLNDGKIENIIP